MTGTPMRDERLAEIRDINATGFSRRAEIDELLAEVYRLRAENARMMQDLLTMAQDDMDESGVA